MTTPSLGDRHDLVVVGAGLVGLATAFAHLGRHPGADVVVVEAAPRVGTGQSGHNSGVLHAGVYYEPGSLKARLCGRGKAMLEEYTAERGIPVDRCGKVVVALDHGELDRLAELERRATANQVPGLRRLDVAGLREVEPAVAGIAALHSPGTGVIDFGAVCRALAADVTAAGGEVRLSTPVVDLVGRGDHVTVATAAGRDDLTARRVVVCAGLQADRLPPSTDGTRIVPFRGTWSLLAPEHAQRIRGNVYPVPDPRYPFLGVHLTPRRGQVWVGPNAVLAGSRTGNRRGALDRDDLRDTATHRGFWRLAADNVVAGARELTNERLRGRYAAEVARMLPGVTADDLLPGPSGTRAQAVRRDGSLVDDFLLDDDGLVLRVRNAPSPAATASLAIGEHLADLLG